MVAKSSQGDHSPLADYFPHFGPHPITALSVTVDIMLSLSVESSEFFFWCTLRILYAFRQNVSVSQTPTGALPLDPLGDYDNYVVFQRPQCYLIAATAFETSSKLLRWLLMIFSGTTSTSTHRISICDRTTHTSK